MCHFVTRCVIMVFCLLYFTACATGSAEKNHKPGEKLHLKVEPEQAITILDEVAAQNGWSVVSVGDQYDMQGQRGKYFRIETDRFIGGNKHMSGVFFSES